MKKITISISILIVVIILLNVFTACTNNDKDNQEATAVKVTNVYKTEYINLPEDLSITGSSFYVYDETVYIMCYEVLDEETWETRSVLYSVGLDGTGENYTYLDYSYIYNYIVLPNGGMIIYDEQYDYDTGTSSTEIITLDAAGNVVSSFDPQMVVSTNEDYFYINYMTISTDNTLYLTCDTLVTAVTLDGKKLFDIECDNYIQQLSAANDGKVVVQYYDYNSSSSGYVFRYIDPQKKQLGDMIDIPNTNSWNNKVFFGDGYDLYIKDSDSVYGYNTTSGEQTQLMNFINSDVNPNNIDDLKIVSADKFLYKGYDYYTEKTQITILTRVPDDEVTPKKLINMAYLYADTYEFTNSVISFNRQSNEYRIVMTDYSKYNTNSDYEAGQTHFNNDIMSGNIPDIMILNTIMPINSYINKGLFADLYSFMDDKSILVNCVRKSYETNGKLYQLPISFNINTLVGKSSIVGNGDSWTLDEMMDLLHEYPDSALTYDISSENVFYMLLYFGFNDYIDYDNATCSFDSAEFIKILNYINEFDSKSFYEKLSDDERNEFWSNRYNYYNENKVLLQDASFGSFSEYLNIKTSYKDEDITFIGYPSNSGNGTIISSNNIYTIAEKSKVKDGAWEFLEYMLSDDVQVSDRTYYFPVTKSGLLKKAEKEQSYYYFFYNDGGWSSSDSPLESEWYDESQGTFARLTDEDVQFMYDLFEKAGNTISYDQTLYNMIMEEISVYLGGAKSAEETAKVIQSRVSIYISESY